MDAEVGVVVCSEGFWGGLIPRDSVKSSGKIFLSYEAKSLGILRYIP